MVAEYLTFDIALVCEVLFRFTDFVFRTFNYTSIAFVPYECVEGKDVLAGEDEVDLRQYPLIEEERSQKESLHSKLVHRIHKKSKFDTFNT